MYMPLLKLLSETILWTESLPSGGLYLQLLPSSSQQEFVFKYNYGLMKFSKSSTLKPTACHNKQNPNTQDYHALNLSI